LLVNRVEEINRNITNISSGTENKIVRFSWNYAV